MKTTLIILMMLMANTLVAQTLEQKRIFLDSVNKYRTELGLRPYVYDFEADALAQQRVETIIERIEDVGETVVRKNPRSYLHFRATEDYIDYNEMIIERHQDTIGWHSECTAFLMEWWCRNPETLHWKLFNGWKSSPEHWKMTMEPNLVRLAVSWKYYNGQIVASLVIFDHKPRRDKSE